MPDDFKIHSILLTKNEEDVIADCLKAASLWSDYIYVYDGASTDRTWEIVKSMASDRIIPWKQDGKVFQEALRAEVFHAFRHLSRHHDWWLQLNADEFYPESPRDFFARVPAHDYVVWGISIEYVLTPVDVDTIDFSQPFAQVMPRLRYYRANHNEIRAFRDRKRLHWDLDCGWPRHIGPVTRERILFKHYPYRSPQQIQTRLDIRRDNRARGFPGWEHASQLSWKEKIFTVESCQLDRGDGHYVIDESTMIRHIEPWPKRTAARILHGLAIWP
jgi:hypothetical protein